MTDKTHILAFLKQNKLYIQSKFDVKKIALFGSYAKDEATKESDIDIVVDMKSSFDNYFDLKYFLEDHFKTKVDLAKEHSLRLLVKERIKDELIYV